MSAAQGEARRSKDEEGEARGSSFETPHPLILRARKAGDSKGEGMGLLRMRHSTKKPAAAGSGIGYESGRPGSAGAGDIDINRGEDP